MMSQILNTLGLILTIVGVLGLFRYGMPFHVPAGGQTIIGEPSDIDESELRLERRYGRIAGFSLVLVVIGTGLQIWGTWAG